MLRGSATATTILEGRSLLDCVGRSTLEQIVRDCLRLLGTSSVVIDKQGNYALGLFDSTWCRFLHRASRNLCATADDREAMRSGKWHCHESCWKGACQEAIQSRKPVDVECRGGLRLYAVPVMADQEPVAAMALSYGEPPKQRNRLAEVAVRYGVQLDQLKLRAEAHERSPEAMIELAKQQLAASARVLGDVVAHCSRLSADHRNEQSGHGPHGSTKAPGCLPTAEQGIFVSTSSTIGAAGGHTVGGKDRRSAGRRKIRVLLADDHRILRNALASMLADEQDLEIVGEAGDGVEAVELASQYRPDVILMDITMPRLNGIEATRRITATWPQVRVIGLSMHEEEGMAAQMREAGASAYLTKGGSPDQLLATIRREPTKRGPMSL